MAITVTTLLARLQADPRVREVYQDDDQWWIWLADGWTPARPARVFRGGRFVPEYGLILGETLFKASRKLDRAKQSTSMSDLNSVMTAAEAAAYFTGRYGRANALTWARTVAQAATGNPTLVQWWQDVADLLTD